MKDENQRLRDENKDFKDANKGLKDERDKLLSEIERMRFEIEGLRKQFDVLIEDKKRDNEERKKRKTDKQKYLEIAKRVLANKAEPEVSTLLEEQPIMEHGAKPKRGGDSIEPIQRPKIKAFVEFEKSRKPYYTHYIAHPCPYCMPPQDCPLHGPHTTVAPGRLTPQELDDVRNMLQGDDLATKAKAFRALYIHAQSFDMPRQFIEQRFPGQDCEAIISLGDVADLGMELANVMESVKGGESSIMRPGMQESILEPHIPPEGQS